MPRNSPKIWAFAELMFKKMTYFQFSTWETGAYLSQVYKPIILKVRNRIWDHVIYNFTKSAKSAIPILHCGSFWLHRTKIWGISCTFILSNFCSDASWYHDNIVICLNVFDLSRNGEIKLICIFEWHHLEIPTLATYKHWDVSEDSSYWESTVRNLILQYAWNILKPWQS